jgi:hypothetical protein
LEAAKTAMMTLVVETAKAQQETAVLLHLRLRAEMGVEAVVAP